MIINLDFQKAFITFKSQVVYCPDLKKTKNSGIDLTWTDTEKQLSALVKIFNNISVNEADIEMSKFSDFSFAGQLIQDSSILDKFVKGMIDPMSHIPLKLKYIDENVLEVQKRFKRPVRSKKQRVRKDQKLAVPHKNKGIKAFFCTQAREVPKFRFSNSQEYEDSKSPWTRTPWIKEDNSCKKNEILLTPEDLEDTKSNSQSDWGVSTASTNENGGKGVKKSSKPKFNFK